METAENYKRNSDKDTVSPLLFIVLVPHRDCLPALEAYRRDIFAAGFDGAFSFPAAAPLALLKRPLDVMELKVAAAELRKNLGEKKIVSEGQADCNGWENSEPGHTVLFFGLTLDLPLPAFPPDAVLKTWKKPILAPAILIPDDNPELQFIANKTAPDLSFRAAALANLALQPTGSAESCPFERDFSFTWELGPLYWLPRYKGNYLD
ncbi:MAG: hypothetical protein FWG29_10875 [Treponema sp.]|nr:hypothetical protein [Treponema sp.]